MLRIAKIHHITRLLNAPVIRTSLVNIANDGYDSRLGCKIAFINRNYCSSRKGDGEKVGDESIKSHPQSKPCESQDPVKLKECQPVSIHPCKPPPPGFPTKIPSVKQCSTPNMMSEMPEPTCPFDEEDGKRRASYRKLFLLGLLFTAITLGTVWNLGMFDYHEENIRNKKEKPKSDNKRKQRQKRAIIKDPPTSKEIPSNVPYLLIGGGTASFAAFRAIKSSDPTAKVLVVTNESFFPYMRPPLSKEIWFNDDPEAVKKLIFKQWNGSERSLFYEPDDFYTKCQELMENPNGGVAVARGWQVIEVDVIAKKAILEDGYAIHYDKCLLATGATPRLSPIFEVAVADEKIAEKVKLFRNIYDFEECMEAYNQSKTIAIVGGGFLGSELACAMARRDKKKTKTIYQLFREGGNMGKILPEYLSYWTTEKVKAEGVTVMPKTEVIGVKNDGKGLELELSNNKKLHVDFVLVAIGVEPNTELAEKSDLEVDPELGGYLVNTELQARSDLYIAGDAACFYDARLGRRRVEHHDHAVVTGRLAGENMTGGRKPYLHQSMFWSDLGPDVGFEAIGVVDSSLPTVAVFAKATGRDHPQAVVTQEKEGLRSNTEEVSLFIYT
ncbi:unnamed protein product [Acanthoscelides obtectus]|uniref:Apoptosis-inducing factor 1, mitochondrial n=1 Tax=Acanthoscelides obtectus TaxID=200917 RepID=A0A9P0LEF6_ACAOB|nr:unnamed protein product [Acanthoscelides obtectus]CAK1664941.1 Apoptosis-inducing factor 1, mitochondrial [Acanthoscelides obtectus]